MNRISILYANRNREPERIERSLSSLKRQTLQNFEVIFVDYGSAREITQQLETSLNQFSFVKYHVLPVRHLLWNKSKALNYGILHAENPYIFIADVDIIFHPQAMKYLDKLCEHQKFHLFSLGYLSQRSP